MDALRSLSLVARLSGRAYRGGVVVLVLFALILFDFMRRGHAGMGAVDDHRYRRGCVRRSRGLLDRAAGAEVHRPG